MPFADISKCSIDLQVIKRSAEGLGDHVSNAVSPHKFVSELRPTFSFPFFDSETNAFDHIFLSPLTHRKFTAKFVAHS